MCSTRGSRFNAASGATTPKLNGCSTLRCSTLRIYLSSKILRSFGPKPVSVLVPSVLVSYHLSARTLRGMARSSLAPTSPPLAHCIIIRFRARALPQTPNLQILKPRPLAVGFRPEPQALGHRSYKPYSMLKPNSPFMNAKV